MGKLRHAVCVWEKGRGGRRARKLWCVTEIRSQSSWTTLLFLLVPFPLPFREKEAHLRGRSRTGRGTWTWKSVCSLGGFPRRTEWSRPVFQWQREAFKIPHYSKHFWLKCFSAERYKFTSFGDNFLRRKYSKGSKRIACRKILWCSFSTLWAQRIKKVASIITQGGD